MNLAYKKILGKFTKVLGFGKTPPHVGKNSQMISFFFLRAYLTDLKELSDKRDNEGNHRLSCEETSLTRPRQNQFDKFEIFFSSRFPCLRLVLIASQELVEVIKVSFKTVSNCWLFVLVGLMVYLC